MTHYISGYTSRTKKLSTSQVSNTIPRQNRSQLRPSIPAVSGDDDGSWQDQQPLILAAGGAGLVLLALLVWAVIDTSANSRAPDTVQFAPSSATSSTYTTKSTSSTSYSVPRVQTSQDNPVAPGPAESTPTDTHRGPETTGETPTTTNPYVTTTTSIA